MVVVPHETPGEDCPTIEIANFSKFFDELKRFVLVIEDELTTRDAAEDVIGATGKEKSWMSRHGIPPMRGRAALILLILVSESTRVGKMVAPTVFGTLGKCGNVYVAPLWHPSAPRASAIHVLGRQ
jgi:hypothetical protein